MEGHIKPNDALIEIGIGSGFTSNYLRSKNINVLTVDIDEQKLPDVVSDATKFIPDKNYDHFCAFEVFEHMKFDEMNIVLKTQSIFYFPLQIRNLYLFQYLIRSSN